MPDTSSTTLALSLWIGTTIENTGVSPFTALSRLVVMRNSVERLVTQPVTEEDTLSRNSGAESKPAGGRCCAARLRLSHPWNRRKVFEMGHRQ